MIANRDAKDAAARTDSFGDPLPEAAQRRLGTVRFSAGEPISAAALSPDGKFFAVCGNRAIWLIDAATGQRGRRIDTQVVGARAVGFSPDGKTLVGAGYNQLSFWDVATGQKKPNVDFKLQGAGMTEFSFSADGLRMTAGTGSGECGREISRVTPVKRKGRNIGSSCEDHANRFH